MNKTPDPATPKELFILSLERCAENEDFVPAFYDEFLNASDQVRKHFRFTSFEKQNQMLLASLRLSAGATNGDPDSLRELKARSESHSRDRMNIEPELYDLWLEALIKAASKYDPEWNPEIENAWRTILGFVIHRMTTSY